MISEFHEFLAEHVPIYGIRWASYQLSVSYNTVDAYCKKHGIEYADLGGWIKASVAAKLLGCTSRRVYTMAKTEKAHLILVGYEGKATHLVKESWLRETKYLSPENSKGMMSTKEFARELGCGTRLISGAARGRGGYLFRIFRAYGIKPVVISNRIYFWKLPDVLKIKKHLNSQQKESDGLVLARGRQNAKILFSRDGTFKAYVKEFIP